MAWKKIRNFWRLFPRASTFPMYWKSSVMGSSQTQGEACSQPPDKAGLEKWTWSGFENAFPHFQMRRNENFPLHTLFISGFCYTWYQFMNTSLKFHRDFHKDPRQKSCCFSVYTLVLLSDWNMMIKLKDCLYIYPFKIELTSVFPCTPKLICILK